MKTPSSPDLPSSPNLIYTDWTLTESQFDPEQLHSRETVFTIGNGYLGTRGSFEEGYPHALPTTLVHGVYDDVPVVFTELVNCPDWLSLLIIINGERFRLDRGEIINYERQLDLRCGLLTRSLRWRSPKGKTIDLRFERFASFADPHVLGLHCQITAIDFKGTIEVQASINGYSDNQGFNHWEQLDQGKIEKESDRDQNYEMDDASRRPSDSEGIWLQVRTRGSRIELGMAAKLSVIDVEANLQMTNTPGYPTVIATFNVVQGQTINIEKIVTLFTSQQTENPVQAAQDKLTGLPSYATLQEAHRQAWVSVWEHSDIEIGGNVKAQLAVRYNLFQLLIAASPHNDQVSIPAKTLSGFGYRGHIFWDTEIFILPFFTFTQPAIARNLLTYRYHTLDGARRKASDSGYQGAMFSWESAATGDEVTPLWSMPNDPYAKAVRIWCRDREIHISTDIAYAVWQYWQATGDDLWLRDYGSEIILDTAIFWMSRLEWNVKLERYELCGVIGADEYHEQVNNNTFTNRMVQWHLEKAVAVHDWLQQKFPDRATDLFQKLQLSPDQSLKWKEAIAQIYVSYNQENQEAKVIEQCDGFFELKDIDLSSYEPRDRSIQAVLGMDATNESQVLKQPDVLMLLYLMRDEFGDRQDLVQKNWNYYAPRTDSTYGSSLTSGIHAIIAANVGADSEANHHFLRAAMVDLEDNRGNTPDGIHAASAGGIWQAVVFGFGGIQLKDNKPVANPHLPNCWTYLKFKLQWHNTWYSFDLASTLAPFPEIQGFIFDLDGVLTDTAEFHYRAWQKLADEEKIPFDRKANEPLRGVARRESLMLIIGDRDYSEEAIQEMMDRKNRYYVESIEDTTPQDVLSGVIKLLKELRQSGIKIAIASASKNARPVIAKLGIADLVDAIADGYSVEKPKPAPDLFLFAATQIGIAPDKCIVVEDAPAGVEAAISAGMWAIGLAPKEHSDRFNGTAHIVLPNLTGFNLSDIQAKLGK